MNNCWSLHTKLLLESRKIRLNYRVLGIQPSKTRVQSINMGFDQKHTFDKKKNELTNNSWGFHQQTLRSNHHKKKWTKPIDDVGCWLARTPTESGHIAKKCNCHTYPDRGEYHMQNQDF